jgi:Uma2 family endonuclease
MDSSVRHEFMDGEIYAMAGGSRNHAALAIAIGGALLNAARDRDCLVQSSDLRIYVEAVDLATFPDVSVICGPMQEHKPGPEETALNPMILVEVTSNSSEEYDLGSKREYYRTIPSLREYVVVSHRERRITVDSRNVDGTWVTGVASRGERFELSSLQATIEVDEVYRNSTIP